MYKLRVSMFDRLTEECVYSATTTRKTMKEILNLIGKLHENLQNKYHEMAYNICELEEVK